MPSVFSGLERRDGEVMDMDDEDALLEFGFLLNVLQFFQDIVWVGDLDAPPTGTCDDNVPAPKRGRRRKRQEASPQKPSPQNNNTNVPDAHAEQKVRPSTRATAAFPEVQRRDGERMTSADENALLEFGAFYYILSFFGDGDGAFGYFPAADDNFTRVGIEWGKAQRETEDATSSLLQRIDGAKMTEEDEEALLYYGAWALIGSLMISIKRRIFGEMNIVADTSSTSTNKKEKGLIMTRTPSGAELNAWVGLAAQKAFGLDKPDRTVRTRGVL